MPDQDKQADESKDKAPIVVPASEPLPEMLVQGTCPDVLDPMASGVTTQDRAAEYTDDTLSSDPLANRPLR